MIQYHDRSVDLGQRLAHLRRGFVVERGAGGVQADAGGVSGVADDCHHQAKARGLAAGDQVREEGPQGLPATDGFLDELSRGLGRNVIAQTSPAYMSHRMQAIFNSKFVGNALTVNLNNDEGDLQVLSEMLVTIGNYQCHLGGGSKVDALRV